MRRILLLFLALVLTGCAGRPTPIIIATHGPANPTQTPGLTVQTVIVTVIVTSLAGGIPPATPVPLLHEMPPTKKAKTPLPSSSTSTPVEPADSELVVLDSALGGNWFSTITLTGKALSLRCQDTHQITFNVTPSDASITQVDLYYRIEDRTNNAVFDWQGPRRMEPNEAGGFTLLFQGEDVNPNFRKPNAWLDFQFVGLDPSGGRVGNSEKIVQQVSYTLDCP